MDLNCGYLLDPIPPLLVVIVDLNCGYPGTMIWCFTFNALNFKFEREQIC